MPTPLGDEGCTVSLPGGLKPSGDQPEGELVVGDVRSDPAVVEVRTVAVATPSDEDLAQAAEMFEKKVFSEDVNGFRRDVPMSRAQGAGTLTLSSHLTQQDGALELFQVIQMQPGALTRVDLLVWQGASPAWKALAPQIAASGRCAPAAPSGASGG